MLQGAFQHRSGRVVALARLLFACISTVAIWADPSQPSRYPAGAYAVLSVYVLVSAVYLLSTWDDWWLEQKLALWAHALDVCLFGAMVFLTEGYTSPFFTFFVFILLTATIRWGWRQTAISSAMVISLFLAAGLLATEWRGASVDTSRVIMRATYLVILSLLLIWFAYNVEEQHRRRVTRGAGEVDASAELPVRSALAAAMASCGSARAALVWWDDEEPWVNLALLKDDVLTQQRHPPGSFGTLVAEELNGRAILFDNSNGRALTLDKRKRSRALEHAHPVETRLATTLGMTQGLAVPVGSRNHGGLLVLSEIEGLCVDDLESGQLAGEALSALMEHTVAIAATQDAAEFRTRLALARDLHDSIVQLLAGTSMRLQGIKQRVAADTSVAQQIETLQRDLADQQRELRLIIGQLREPPTHDVGADLGEVLRDALDRATRQWGVTGALRNCPKSSNKVGTALQRQLQHLLSESVANAVKHGKAANVALSAEIQDDELVMVLNDDGQGLHIESGAGKEPSPWSLYERVLELGGTLSLHSHGRGSQLRFSVPWGLS